MAKASTVRNEGMLPSCSPTMAKASTVRNEGMASRYALPSCSPTLEQD
jgi:hypothetical protein